MSTATPSLHALLLALETQVWEAAQTGDLAADLRLLSPNFLGVYAAGWADREVHAAQLRDGPSVATYALSRVRVLALGDGVGLISYLADFTVPGHSQSLQMRVSSV